MREIKLTQGRMAQIDDEDFEWLNQWKWCVQRMHNTYYAIRKQHIGNRYITIRMHRIIMRTPSHLQVDHKDRNGLNNQRLNLRNCNNSQNQMNKKSSGVSQYLGVSYNHKGRIKANIKGNGKIIHLGTFETEIEAAKAYDNKARELHGEFANLNFK